MRSEETCWLSSHWSSDREVNDLQHAILALTWSDGFSNRPNSIIWLVMSSPITYIFYPDHTFNSTLAASCQPLLIRSYKTVPESQLRWEKRNFTSAENLKLATEAYPQLECTGRVSPVSTKANRLPVWFIPNTSWTPWKVVERMASEKYTAYMAYSNKKIQTKPVRIRLWEWGSRLPQIHCYWIFGGGLPSQILLFPHRKVISTWASPKAIKKTRNGNLLVEVDSWKQAENIKNENVSYDVMQSLPTWETKHYYRSYQE